MKTLTGYSDHISLHPDETISFFVSSEDGAAYRARIVRIINGDLNPEGRGYREEAIASDIEGVYEGLNQPIHAGSCAVIPAPEPMQSLSSFTIAAMIWPTTPLKGEQTILSCWAESRGFEFFIDQVGALGLRIGDGRSVHVVSTGKPLLARCWYVACGSYDPLNGRLTVGQSRVGGGSLDDDEASQTDTAPRSGGFAPAPGAPLVLAAFSAPAGQAGAAFTKHYNGKLECPRIFTGVLVPETAAAPLEAIKDRDDLLAAWDFSLEMEDDAVRDISRHALHGRTVHMPTRAMTGHNWTGEEMCWRHRPAQYGAIHFHDDDVYDAGWSKSFEWRVPSGLHSGVYCAHIFDERSEEFIPFVVRPAKGLACKKLVFLLPTASYMAYANERLGLDHAEVELLEGKVTVLHEHDLFLAEHREYGNSLYGVHSDGSGSAHSSRLRPIMNMRPKVHSYLGGSGSAVWQFNADTHILDFLEASDLEFDVICDEDLDRDGVAALNGCICLVTGTHPEYVSTRMLDAVDDFKGRGGRLIYMGGNGFYWRVAFHPTKRGVVELRRAEDGIRSWASMPGEYYHAFTGEYGGLWQRNGRPPQSSTGAGTTAQGFDVSSYYRRTEQSHDPRAAFVFEGVEGDIIGDFGLIGGGAAGLEIDRADFTCGTPRNALVLASSEDHSDTYLMVPEDIGTTLMVTGGVQSPFVHADLVFTPLASGGAMFAMSSIAWAGSLSHNGFNNNVARLTTNVIHRFLDPAPFS